MYTVEDLFQYFRIFLSSSDLSNLSMINKKWKSMIHPDWLENRYYCPRAIEQLSIPSTFLFLEYVDIFRSSCRKIIIPKRILHLKTLSISASPRITYIEAPKSIQHCYIRDCPLFNLKCLKDIISVRIISLQLNDMQLENFAVSREWVNLEYLVLTNSNISELEIPKECNKLGVLNISGTTMKKLTIKADLDFRNFLIFSHNMKFPLRIISKKEFCLVGSPQVQFETDI